MKKLIFVGDIHGRIDLLKNLLNSYSIDDYFYVFCGDLNDYGDEYRDISSSLDCINIVSAYVARGLAECVKSNHQDKLMRYLKGAKVTPSHGLNNTITEIEKKTQDYRDGLAKWLEERPYFFKISEDGKDYVAVHAYFDDYMLDIVENTRALENKKKLDWFKSCCIYGMTTKTEGRIEFWRGDHIEKNITKFHLISGHYHQTINRNNFTMLDTSDRAIKYFIPSLKFVGGVEYVDRRVEKRSHPSDEG